MITVTVRKQARWDKELSEGGVFLQTMVGLAQRNWWLLERPRGGLPIDTSLGVCTLALLVVKKASLEIRLSEGIEGVLSRGFYGAAVVQVKRTGWACS